MDSPPIVGCDSDPITCDLAADDTVSANANDPADTPALSPRRSRRPDSPVDLDSYGGVSPEKDHLWGGGWGAGRGNGICGFIFPYIVDFCI